ncbi:MAG TPA: zinc-binding alcohol dehydrogenase [Stellaceae bacterium]|nr:zinc-binding alcohol dehydrogenase [Stellaceae bacterium]
MSERAQAFWVTAPGEGAIRAEDLPPPGRGEALVRALASGISRGTESLIFQGRVPKSEWQRMRCPFQSGEFPAPVKYGYASVGVVEALGPESSGDLRGRRVFCLHPHQDRYVVPAVALAAVPDAVPDRRAVLAANMETAVNALWDAGPRIGDRIAVVGAGVVGSLVAALAARIPGTAVELIDIDPRRADLAAALGCRFATPDGASGKADLVLHASGAPEGLATALSLAGFEARVVELSWYGDRPVTLPLGEDFHARRLQLLSSQVGQVAAPRRARRSHRDRMALALALLAEPCFDRLLSGESAFADLPATMARLAQAPDGALCHVIRY